MVGVGLHRGQHARGGAGDGTGERPIRRHHLSAVIHHLGALLVGVVVPALRHEDKTAAASSERRR